MKTLEQIKKEWRVDEKNIRITLAKFLSSNNLASQEQIFSHMETKGYPEDSSRGDIIFDVLFDDRFATARFSLNPQGRKWAKRKV